MKKILSVILTVLIALPAVFVSVTAAQAVAPSQWVSWEGPTGFGAAYTVSVAGHGGGTVKAAELNPEYTNFGATSNSQAGMYQKLSFESGAEYEISFWAKAKGKVYFRAMLTNENTPTSIASPVAMVYDPGDLGANGGGYGFDWRHITYSYTAPAAMNACLLFYTQGPGNVGGVIDPIREDKGYMYVTDVSVRKVTGRSGDEQPVTLPALSAWNFFNYNPDNVSHSTDMTADAPELAEIDGKPAVKAADLSGGVVRMDYTSANALKANTQYSLTFWTKVIVSGGTGSMDKLAYAVGGSSSAGAAALPGGEHDWTKHTVAYDTTGQSENLYIKLELGSTNGTSGEVWLSEVKLTELPKTIYGANMIKNWDFTEKALTASLNVTEFSVEEGDGTLALSWQNPADPYFTGVNIYRMSASESLTFIASASGTDYTVSGAVNGDIYHFVVKSVNAEETESAGASAFGIPAPPKTVMGTPTISRSAGNVTVTAQIKNNSLGNSENVSLIVCLTDGDSLLAANGHTQTLNNGQQELFSVSIADPGGDYKVHLYIWDGLGTYKPLAEAYIEA